MRDQYTVIIVFIRYILFGFVIIPFIVHCLSICLINKKIIAMNQPVKMRDNICGVLSPCCCQNKTAIMDSEHLVI